MKNVNIILIIGIIMILLGIFWQIIYFYNDYKCSTTKDIGWFMNNNCMKYVEREIRNGNN